jgi:hypothetical protein
VTAQWVFVYGVRFQAEYTYVCPPGTELSELNELTYLKWFKRCWRYPFAVRMSTTPAREQLWSLIGVEAVINAPGLPHQQREYVMRLRSAFRRAPEIDPDALKLSVVYERSAHGFGRRFESPRGLQGVSRAIRRVCAARYYKDWDIENAYPVILEGKLKAAAIQCPRLSAYVDNREARQTCLLGEHTC